MQFYSPTNPAADTHGRTLASILAWNDDRLETCHNYIQILFPLPEGSPFNPAAPIINRATFAAFRSRPELRARLRESFVRMLSFYGFQLDVLSTDRVQMIPAPNFATASKNWVTRFNHNHLRITRIIRSLRVLGLEGEGDAFYIALKELCESRRGVISQKSLMFWTRAAKRPLYLAPEDEEDEGDGKEFLYNFEREQQVEDDGREPVSGGARTEA